MTMTGIHEDALARSRDCVRELEAEVRELRAQLEGDIPTATFWLQTKVWRQRRALDALNRRVLSQRFVLRTLEELGRGLSREEYLAARDRQPESIRDRIDDPE